MVSHERLERLQKWLLNIIGNLRTVSNSHQLVTTLLAVMVFHLGTFVGTCRFDFPSSYLLVIRCEVSERTYVVAT